MNFARAFLALVAAIAALGCSRRDGAAGSESASARSLVTVDGAHATAVPSSATPRKETTKMPEHAVIVRFKYGLSDLKPLRDVEDRLKKAIDAAGVGDYDGDEIAVDLSDGTLYMYGPDADRLFAAVRPALDATAFMQGAKVTLRYGPPADGTSQKQVVIGSAH